MFDDTDVVEVVETPLVLEVLEASVTVIEIIQAGPQGPPGPPGAAGAGTVVPQPSPAGTWIIPHTLGRPPVVACFDPFGERIYPDEHASSTSLTLIFASPTAGTAVLI